MSTWLVRDAHARATAFPVFRGKLSHEVSYVSPPLPPPSRPFLPRSPRLQAVSPREISHVQAGQCGNQMGTKVWEVVSLFRLGNS
jgi:hypothetical protein